MFSLIHRLSAFHMPAFIICVDDYMNIVVSAWTTRKCGRDRCESSPRPTRQIQGQASVAIRRRVP